MRASACPLTHAALTCQGACASSRPTESQAPRQNKNPPHGPMVSAKQTPATSPQLAGFRHSSCCDACARHATRCSPACRVRLRPQMRPCAPMRVRAQARLVGLAAACDSLGRRDDARKQHERVRHRPRCHRRHHSRHLRHPRPQCPRHPRHPRHRCPRLRRPRHPRPRCPPRHCALAAIALATRTLTPMSGGGRDADRDPGGRQG